MGQFFEENDPDRKLKYRKRISSISTFSSEPFVYSEITRYMLGGTIKATLSDSPGYVLQFLRFGDGMQEEKVKTAGDWQEMVLAPGRNLLLPGEGYLIFITPAPKTGSDTKE
ncbi:MAG: hypothetical protein RQ899_14575 [Pseudomonadales bacterium]|nr:hypothetical protein [Pseudomonadales bacterium]